MTTEQKEQYYDARARKNGEEPIAFTPISVSFQFEDPSGTLEALLEISEGPEMSQEERLVAFRRGHLVLEGPSEEDSWILDAERIIHGPRRASYAHPLINFLRIAIEWSLWLMGRGKLVRGLALDPDDIVWLFDLLKVAGREINRHDDDNGKDTIGYTALWQEIDLGMKQLGFEEGMGWFKGKSIAQLVALLEDLTRE